MRAKAEKVERDFPRGKVDRALVGKHISEGRKKSAKVKKVKRTPEWNLHLAISHAERWASMTPEEKAELDAKNRITITKAQQVLKERRAEVERRRKLYNISKTGVTVKAKPGRVLAEDLAEQILAPYGVNMAKGQDISYYDEIIEFFRPELKGVWDKGLPKK